MKDRSHPSSFPPHPSSLITPIGVAIVEHDRHYLVGVRGPQSPLPGLAEFPGGKCRPGEFPEDCAVRECREETGLVAAPVRLLLNCQHRYEHGDVDLHFWLCVPADASHLAADHRGFRWVSAATLKALHFPPANAPVIELLAAS